MLDWGDVPTWVGGIGTTGALSVSLFLLFREQRRLEEFRQEELRRQASKVTAWLEYELVDGRFAPGTRLWGRVRNGSEEPIFDVHAGYLGRQAGDYLRQFSWEVGVVPPGQTLEMEVSPDCEPIGLSPAEWCTSRR